MSGQNDPIVFRLPRHLLRLLVILVLAGSAVYLTLERGQHAMRFSAIASTPSAPRPLIDTVAPKAIATATFSMG